MSTTEFKKRGSMVLATFCVFLIVTLSLLSLVCYLSFDQNYREIKQSYHAAMCKQVISEMETSIGFGKRIDRYFGINDLFVDTQNLFEEEGYEVAILSNEGETLYSTYAAGSAADQIASSSEMQSTIAESTLMDGYSLVSRNNYEVLLMPVVDGEERVGFFTLSYPMTVYSAQRAYMLRGVGQYLAVVCAAGLIALVAYYFIMYKRMAASKAQTQKLLLFGVPSVIIIVFILIMGVMNYMLFRDRYEEAMQTDAASIVEYVRATTQELNEKGVEYSEMDGLDEYLAEKVQDVPALWNLRISQVLSDSGNVLDRHDSGIITMPIESEEQLVVEAFISEEYIEGKMMELFFMFLATFIFCIVIIIEMTKLPAMLDVRRRKTFNQPTQDVYEHISSGVRIASFLRTFSNYMYLPYSAMLIKQWNQSVAGLSVGVTAALPLTLESAGQVIGMVLYPMFFKRPDRRSRWFFGICLIGMLVINGICFVTDSALTIIVLRLLGGFCYSGFMHMLNMIIAAGDDGEERHQVNLAQSNAGIIGGIMCGAGIGAIVAALAGYSFSYVLSAVMFGLFGLFVLGMMPWKLLEKNAIEDEKIVAQNKPEEKLGLVHSLKIVFSPRVLQYFLLVMVPVNFGILYAVTLIPSMVDAQGSNILLSYCYIVNGIAGFYFGPKLVEILGKRLGNSWCIMIALLVAAAGLIALGVPPFMLMVLLSATLLGVFDGFGSPMATDGFLEIPSIKHGVNEVSALAIYFTLCNVVSVVAPVAIEMMMGGNLTVAIWALAAAYVICAVLFALVSGISKIAKGKGKAMKA